MPPDAPRSPAAVGASLFAIFLLGAVDLLVWNLHVGALVILPLLVLAYYLPPITALLVALFAAFVFSILDDDWGAFTLTSGFSTAVDASILAVSFGAVVLLVDNLRRRELSHAKLATDYARMCALTERDQLTGLPSHAALFERLSALLGVGTRQAERLGVLFFDIDGFKALNLRYGHPGGDRILLMVGERLRATFRDAGIVARTGGDEFAALIESVRDRNDLTKIAQNLEAALAEPIVVGPEELRLSVSIGAALFPDDALDADTLLARADSNMGLAKRTKGAGA